MQIVYNTESFSDKIREYKSRGNKITLIPTMGNLHQGHLDLVRRASDLADIVIVSIFVNPMQFGPHEDFDTYPQTLNLDCQALAGYDCAAVLHQL